jgi:perosamine synthetase
VTVTTETPVPAFIPLVRSAISDTDRHYVAEFAASGEIDSDSEVQKLESVISRDLQAAGAVAVSSGTAAIHVALKAAGVRQGDEVILPSYTCVALLHAVRLAGATPVLVDSNTDVTGYDLAPNTDAVRRALTRRSKAILISDMFGALNVPEELCQLGLPIIEDFTLSVGAASGSRRAGCCGTLGVASFRSAKMISAGQGGIVVSGDRSLLANVRALSEYDSDMGAWRTMPASEMPHHFATRFSYGMAPLAAALAISQWMQLPQFVERRIALARTYYNFFSELGIECANPGRGTENVFFRYLISTPHDPVSVISRVRAYGIELGRGIFPPLHVFLPQTKRCFPGAERCCSRLISVPLYPSLSDEEVDRILTTVREALAGHA